MHLAPPTGDQARALVDVPGEGCIVASAPPGTLAALEGPSLAIRPGGEPATGGAAAASSPPACSTPVAAGCSDRASDPRPVLDSASPARGAGGGSSARKRGRIESLDAAAAALSLASPPRPPPAPSPLELALADVIAEGAFGVVRRARLAAGGVRVAVKFPRYDAQPAEAVNRTFRHEEAALRSLPPHPNVIRFVGCARPASPGEATPIVTLLLGGGTVLDRIMRLGRPLNLYEARHVLVGCVRALVHLHAHGLIHRDIKCVPARPRPARARCSAPHARAAHPPPRPCRFENVFFSDEDGVVVGDLGSSYSMGRGGIARVQPSLVACAPNFIPPEVLSARLGVAVVEQRANTDSWTLATMVGAAVIGALLPDGELSVRGREVRYAHFDLPQGVLDALRTPRTDDEPRLGADLEAVLRALRAFHVSERTSATDLLDMEAFKRLAEGCPCNGGPCVCSARLTLRQFAPRA